jgi:hypothetical protein
MLAQESREKGFDAFKNSVDRLMSGKEKRGAPPGLKVIRINFGMESQEYEMLKRLSEEEGMNLSEYSARVLQDHVRSAKI